MAVRIPYPLIPAIDFHQQMCFPYKKSFSYLLGISCTQGLELYHFESIWLAYRLKKGFALKNNWKVIKKTLDELL